MKKFLAGLVVVLVTGCGFDKADGFRQGIPQQANLELKLPSSGQSSQPLTGTGTRRDGLEGQTADLYKTTRAVTQFVNGGTVLVLDLVRRITQYPATTVTQDSAVWGPRTEALSPNTWKLTVTRTAPDTYTYALEGKGKTEADSAFRVVLSGSHVDAGANVGNGSFLLDFDKAKTLPENDGNVGTVSVTYSRPTLSAEIAVDADFHQVKSDAQLVNAQYKYRATPGNGGTFDFDLDKDFTAGPALEHGKIRSRWVETGAGRSDVQATGGDLTSPVTLSECWDDGFASRFLEASYSPSSNYGQASVCAFTTAQYAAL